MRCSACGFENPLPMRFCGGCGQALSETEAERRQVAVLFCDVEGSTQLSERFDPEDLRDIVRAYQSHASACVDRYEGHIAQFLGDGVLVYFGYPVAHEDDAERAIRAGLEILAGLPRLNETLADRDVVLKLRLGVHTGGVVAGRLGSGASQEALALGVVPNVAARLESMAEANTMLISSDTHRLIRHRIACEALGARQLKGISAPLEVYRVVRERELAETGAETGLHTPLRGRSDEAARLRAGFAESAEGGRHTLLLDGDPGIGKTRLLQELHRDVADEATWLQCSCSALATTSALYPIAAMLARTFELRRADEPGESLETLAAGLRGFAERVDEVLPLFAELLSIPHDETHPTLDVGADRKRQKTFDALLELLGQWSHQRPLVFAVEDLHWADPSTLDFIGRVAEKGPDGVFAVFTARTPFDAPWTGSVERLSLAGLGEGWVAELVADAAGDLTLAPELLRYVADRTDGIPLFARELTSAVLESGALREGPEGYVLEGAVADQVIPTTLRGSLTARIDRFPEARPVAQLGATIGRDFGYAILREVSDLPDVALRSALDQLVKAEILDQHGEPPEARYSFRHALIQEAAYELLLKRVRREHHAKIARALAESFPERTEIQPELVARHFSEAGLAPDAIRYWRKAGERAVKRSATAEAISHLEAGLALLATQPATPERDGEELGFLIALGNASLPTRGFTAPEVQQIYLRAGELGKRVGSRPEQFWAIEGLLVYHLVRADLDDTLRIAHTLLELANDTRDPVHDAVARLNIGTTWFYRGDFPQALVWLEQAIAAAPQSDREMRDNVGLNLQGSSHGYAALTLWHLGEFERAKEYGQRALELAREANHASSLAQVMVFAGCLLHQFQRDHERTAEYARELIALSQDRGFPIWQMQATVFEGFARAQLLEDGDLPGFADTAERMAGSVALYRAAGGRLALAHQSVMWAQTLVRLGRREEAAKLMQEALEVAETTGDRLWEAEQRRLLGTLALDAGDVAEAERRFRAALATARRQGSRALELRTAISLARQLREHGSDEEANALLVGVCGHFDPETDSEDLREARALLP